jgi:CRP-like cAMP-binding protein
VADRFFVVMRGEVSVQVTDRRVVMGLDGDDRVEETVREVARIQMGEVFGETTLKENAKRAVNTLAVTDCEFF